jgi:hypothetical protein
MDPDPDGAKTCGSGSGSPTPDFAYPHPPPPLLVIKELVNLTVLIILKRSFVSVKATEKIVVTVWSIHSYTP